MSVGSMILLGAVFGWFVGCVMGRAYQAHCERLDRMRSAASEKAAWAAATKCHDELAALKRDQA